MVVQPIPRFPAHLIENPTVKFLVGEGVPRPAGKPGGLRVIMLGDDG